ncbi:hypothetical protein EI94DRAFT_1702127 [Lactarius quietus]|nr:hypothetical protein EI94DRAFT_1702127 [Lactarius quietus]
MATPTCDQDHLAEKLLPVRKPCFCLFSRSGESPPETGSSSGTLAIPDDLEDLTTIKLFPKRIIDARKKSSWRESQHGLATARPPVSPSPRQVQKSWPKAEFKSIDKSEASCLRVSDVREKEKGCVMTGAVPRGDLLTRERALLLMPRTFATPHKVANAWANTMLPKLRAEFLAIVQHHTHQFIPGPRNAQPQRPLLGIFETFAHINHSYCPNVMFRKDKNIFSSKIRAMGSISEDEEVTITYFEETLEPAMITRYHQNASWKHTTSNARVRSVSDLSARHRGRSRLRDDTLSGTPDLSVAGNRDGKRKWAQRALAGSDDGWGAISGNRRRADGGSVEQTAAVRKFGFD